MPGAFFDESDYIIDFVLMPAAYDKYWLRFGDTFHLLIIKTALSIDEDTFQKFLKETNSYERNYDIIFNDKKDGERMLELLEPYWIAKKLLGEY